MDQQPKRRMDGMGPRVGMDGMSRSAGPQPQPSVTPPPAPMPAPVPKPRPQAKPAPAPRPQAAPVAAEPAPATAPKAAPAAAPAQAGAPRNRRWLRIVLQGLAWVAIILAVAAALVELWVRYYG